MPALAALLLGCAEVGNLQLDELLSMAGVTQKRGSNLDDGTVIAGLKEALKVGTGRSVSSASSPDGYFRNALIRIAIPDQLETMAKGLRAVGFGGQVDQLELTMNRAAERAAGQAAPVFLDAIRQMSFADARSILSGSNRAATDYFEGKTRTNLFERFSPIVDKSMEQVGLVRVYDDLVGRLTALPLVPKPDLNLRNYVTDSALDGLFTLLSQEEAKIRDDPVARTTDLLRTVFGS